MCKNCPKYYYLAFTKELVFQVWKSCSQPSANGYVVTHSPWDRFYVTIAFLDRENVDFDVLYFVILTFCITLLCVMGLMAAILENGAVCESHTLPAMSARSFVTPTPQWLILDMQTNVGIRLPVPSCSGGLRCSTILERLITWSCCVQTATLWMSHLLSNSVSFLVHSLFASVINCSTSNTHCRCRNYFRSHSKTPANEY